MTKGNRLIQYDLVIKFILYIFISCSTFGACVQRCLTMRDVCDAFAIETWVRVGHVCQNYKIIGGNKVKSEVDGHEVYLAKSLLTK